MQGGGDGNTQVYIRMEYTIYTSIYIMTLHKSYILYILSAFFFMLIEDVSALFFQLF